jgi:hypothetical protein
MDGGGQGAGVDSGDDLERVERDRNKKQNNNKNKKDQGAWAVKRVRPAAALVLAAGLTSYMICKWRFLDRHT